VKLKEIQKEFKYNPCLGIQLDMWTNSDTHTSYEGTGVRFLGLVT